jgi:hypothetical protein
MWNFVNVYPNHTHNYPKSSYTYSEDVTCHYGIVRNRLEGINIRSVSFNNCSSTPEGVTVHKL